MLEDVVTQGKQGKQYPKPPIDEAVVETGMIAGALALASSNIPTPKGE